MCNLPKRPEQHIIDEQGIVLLQTILEPKHYIFRSLGGRDYGIDGLLEVTEDGRATGKMISLQLKSSMNFQDFTETRHDINGNNDEFVSCIGVIVGNISVPIKKATCNYWLQSSFPVLLVLADVNRNYLYYTDIKAQIRQRYHEFKSKDSFTFYVSADSRLEKMSMETIESRKGICNAYRHMMFKKNEILMLEYPVFFNSIQDFVTNRMKYYEHIEHQNADPFLTQSIEFYNTTMHLHRLLQIISRHLDVNFKNIDFHEVREKYKDAYEHFSVWDDFDVLEMEISELHFRIQENMLNIIDALKELIINIEGDFWETQYPRIYIEAEKMSSQEFRDNCYWARI